MKLWVLDFHTATLSNVSDSLLHGKYFVFNQEYYTDSSVFIAMLAKKQIFYSWLFLVGELFSMISWEITAFITEYTLHAL